MLFICKTFFAIWFYSIWPTRV